MQEVSLNENKIVESSTNTNIFKLYYENKLLENEKDVNNLVSIILNLNVAAKDTTSRVLSMTFYYLA